MALTRTHIPLAAALSAAAIAFPAAAFAADPPGAPTLPPPPAAPADTPAPQVTPTPTATPAPAATPTPQLPATPPKAQSAPSLTVQVAPLSGRRLKVRVTCGADGDITVKSGSRTLAHSAFTCRNRAATRTLKLRGNAAKATVLTRSAGRQVKLTVRLGGAHASALTTVRNTCLGGPSGGTQVIGVDFDTSFGVAARGETIFWRAYRYEWNPYTHSGGYVDSGVWHNYMLTDFNSGSVNGNTVVIGGGGYVGSDQQAFRVSHGRWSYGLIATWTQRTGYRWHWIPATQTFAPSFASGGYCWF